MNKKSLIFFALLVLLLLLVLPFIGAVPIPLHALFNGGNAHFIFWQLRIPRVLLGFLCGAILGLSGWLFQILFKNNLATPDILGVTAGSAAGVVLAVKLKFSFSIFGLESLFFFGFLGALTAILLVSAIVRILKNYSIYTLLMSGVAISLFFSSLIVLIQYLFDFANTFSILRWLMGGITIPGYKEVALMLILLFTFLFVLYLFRKELVLLAIGDEFAWGKGLEVKKFRMFFFLFSSFVVGTVVSLTGPIGFIALIVPHIARLLSKGHFMDSIYWTIVVGGGLLILADTLARILLAPVEIPVGIITSFLGAPFFLVILITNLKRNT